MKLIRLVLEGEYKGLRDQTFDFHETSDSVIALIGLNGSGKSQLLELIAETFAYLERKQRADFRARGRFPFSVTVAYDLAEDRSLRLPERRYEVSIDRAGTVQATAVIDRQVSDVEISDLELPSHIVGYASGTNENLQRAFLKNSLQYFDVMKIRAGRRKRLEGLAIDEEAVAEIEQYYLSRHQGIFAAEAPAGPTLLAERDTPLPALTFIDYDSAALLIASLAFQPRALFDRLFPDIRHRYPYKLVLRYDLRYAPVAPDTSRDIQQLIRIVGIHSVQGLCRRSTDAEYEAHELEYLAADIVIDLESQGLRDRFMEAYYQPVHFFEKLHKIQLLGVQAWQTSDKKDLRQDSFFGNVKKPLKTKLPLMVSKLKLQDLAGGLVDFDDLSDGEAQLIQTLGAACLFGRDSLFLFDEPETHLNPVWRTNFHKHLETSIADTDSAQAFVTTHSPFLISSLKKENVFLIERNNSNITTMTQVPHETYGASFEVLIKQHFALKSMISQTAVAEILNKINDQQLSNQQRREWIEQNLGDSMEKAYLLRKLAD